MSDSDQLSSLNPDLLILGMSDEGFYWYSRKCPINL